MDFQFCQPKFGALPVLQEYPQSITGPPSSAAGQASFLGLRPPLSVIKAAASEPLAVDPFQAVGEYSSLCESRAFN